ncbi:hypothetical protein EG68_10427 [Paragonimus skrjabini miyazakii]|uniref:Uncharacterized protein n=1 Tax=Paragonimus skrjabini miyazakii TaxID=59628 RepID=A0A8S9Y9X8_9TREM|nr:hypothetical protein EG68_10427 [Paragonimus skrjabini miyazakii]
MLESWTRIIDSPFARVNHQAIFLGNYLYIFGGYNSQLKDVSHSSCQLDVFRWNIKTNRWEELKYPLRLKAWDCISKSWRSDPLSSNDGSVQPVHRFGHTVVAWRGRGWMFGGRTQQQVCSNQVYMFEPGTCRRTPSPDTTCFIHTSATNTATNLAVQNIQPCWVEVVGLSGSAPSPRDGHAAAVLENDMFIYGGFDAHSERYDDQVYRLDFETWSWTQIQIKPMTISETSSFSSVPAPPALAPYERLLLHTTPLARDFASLISHQGRLFMFGGRSGYTDQLEHDVYDSTLWELVPLKVMTQTAERSDRLPSTRSSFTPAWPFDCSCYTSTIFRHPVAGRGHLRRMVWEAETGNWDSDEFWATCSPHPGCLWRLCSLNSTDWMATRSESQPSTPVSDSHSRWCSGFATWRRLHFGYGLQYADDLLNRLYYPAANLPDFGDISSDDLTDTVAPYGRRSLSHWAYDGNLYIGFGLVRSHMEEDLQLHFNDVWRFSLHTFSWTAVRPHLDNVGPADGVLNHLPSERRRAVACLYIPQPRSVDDHESNDTILTDRPRVFLFGGTQPRLSKRSTAVVRHRGVIAKSRCLTSFAAGRLSSPQTC